MSAASAARPAGSSTTTKIVIYGLLHRIRADLSAAAVRDGRHLAEDARRNSRRQHAGAAGQSHHRALAAGLGLTCIGQTCEGIKGYFWNSIKMVVPAVAISTLLGALNGYVLTKWRFPGHRLVFGLMLFACFIPFQTVLIPMAGILGFFGLANSTAGLVLCHVVYGLGFTTLFFRNYYEAFPNELIKAAQMDGAGFFQIFRRILLPSSGPIIVVTVIYQFTNIWNDFLFGSTFAYGEAAPMTVALNNLVVVLHGREGIQHPYGGGDHRGSADIVRLCGGGALFRARPDGRRGQGVRPWRSWKSRGLRKRFGTVDVLKGIDLTLDKGGFLVLVGPSGCGKSTLLNTIAGLETITSGEIHVDGQAINDLHPSKRDIAMVFQSYALYPQYDGGARTSASRWKCADVRQSASAKRRSAASPSTLQIGHLLDRKPRQLSGGQRQRVAMGRALVRDPQVFLFDEPLSNLDAKLRVDMRTEIKQSASAPPAPPSSMSPMTRSRR
jgi:glucose/mannose transport system permease protein